MDSPELLPCFCGGVATPDAGNYGRKCQCGNENCALYMRELYPQDWNSLQSEIASVSAARVAAAKPSRLDFDIAEDGCKSVEIYREDGTLCVLVDIAPSGIVSAAILDGTTIVAKGMEAFADIDARVAAARAEGPTIWLWTTPDGKRWWTGNLADDPLPDEFTGAKGRRATLALTDPAP